MKKKEGRERKTERKIEIRERKLRIIQNNTAQ